jgi:hypothetical protein
LKLVSSLKDFKGKIGNGLENSRVPRVPVSTQLSTRSTKYRSADMISKVRVDVGKSPKIVYNDKGKIKKKCFWVDMNTRLEWTEYLNFT